MAKNKYTVKEFVPNSSIQNHSFYAEEVIDNIISNQEIADRIEARTGFKSYEVKAIIEALAEVTLEIVSDSNKVNLTFKDGSTWLTLRPDCKGSASDKDVLEKTTAAHAIDPSIPIRTVATEADVTPDLLKWVVASTVGTKFSKLFDVNKTIKKVKNDSNNGSTEEENTTPANPGGGNNGSEEIG